MPLGANKAALMGAAGSGEDTNYFGDESDGSLTTSGDETIPQETDTDDMVILQYSQLTVSSGDAMYRGTVSGRGVFIYVTGNCTINGALHVDATAGSGAAPGAGGGPNADPETNTDSSDNASVSSTGLRLPMFTASGSQTLAAADFAGCGNPVVNAVANQPGISGDGTIYQILRTGGASVSGNSVNGNAGATGADIISAGSGGGGSATGGAGTNGTTGPGICWGGGGGTGGAAGPSRASGNAGFCHGSGQSTGGSGWYGQRSGSGGRGAGTLVLVVGGDLTIGASGRISANGGAPGFGNGDTGCGGGAGGGIVLVLYAGTLSNSGTVQATGASGVGTGPDGGNGGAGGVRIAQISSA